MQSRTDLAIESFENTEKTSIDGVRVRRRGDITHVSVLSENGAREIGKPSGEYVTVHVPPFENDGDIFDGRLQKTASVLQSLLPPQCDNVLVAGLGNLSITADALGPKTGDYVLATRHLNSSLKKEIGLEGLKSVSYIGTGVLGKTGIESAEIVKGVAQIIKPSCVIAVDALAASSASRLGTTVQFSGTGIIPGSGVGNHRFELSFSTLGVPVISVGIPTVIGASLLSGREQDKMFVTPREIDSIIRRGAKLIGMCINVCLQPYLDERDIYALLG